MQVFDRNKSVIAHLNTVPKKKHWDFLLFGILSTQKSWVVSSSQGTENYESD